MDNVQNDRALQFREDLAQLTRTILDGKPPDLDSHLGDVIANMSVNKRLLKRIKDENFDIAESLELSSEAREYLNALQTEKLRHCRQCYYKSDYNRCNFHQKYILNTNNTANGNSSEDYINFMNSEMGVISFIELYYTYLCLDFWKPTAIFLLRDLTGYDSIKSLLTEHGYTCADDVDSPCVYAMDVDDEDDIN
ncbi:AC34-like protein [Orgyia pseudotsugata single capsid nuclopolyhedrovirus]|nr:AC34-like protein [Orgyia pseudotsugata single capsid nuclopolyhedrovirus]